MESAYAAASTSRENEELTAKSRAEMLVLSTPPLPTLLAAFALSFSSYSHKNT